LPVNLTLKMRSLRNAVAAVLLVAGATGGHAFASNDSITQKWAEVKANAKIFAAAAERLGFTSSWSTPRPVRIDLRPPATETQIKSVEALMGTPLPDTLRRFFLEVSEGVDVLWLIPGEIETLPGSVVSVRYGTLPPPPWQRRDPVSDGIANRTVPVVNGGVLNFSLEMLPGLRLRARQWKQQFRAKAETAEDPAQAAHFLRYADFWDRGIPLSSEGSGGILAVDRLDPEGRLMFLFHDSPDAPGWFLDQSLIDFMVTQSRLGFPGIGKKDLLAFGRERVEGSPMAEAYAAQYEIEATRFDLTMPKGLSLETNSNDAEIWRAWLGL